MEKEIFLSVVVPVYNEADKIEKNILKIEDFLKSKGYSFEIIIVNDGSTDNTDAILNILADRIAGVRILHNKVNKGKGFALKTGMIFASGNHVLFTDADLSTPFEEIDKFLPYFKNGYDIVIGSRRLKNSDVEVPQAWHRAFMGKFFIILARLIITDIVNDFNCGFKCYRKEVAHHIYKKGRLNRWGFDVEMLFLADKYGYRVKEVPVKWMNANTTKVSLFKDSVRSFFELLAIRINDLKGFYK